MRQITGRFSTTVCTSWLVTIFLATMLFVGMFIIWNQPVSAHDSQRMSNIEGNLRAELGQSQTGPDLVLTVDGPDEIEVGAVGTLTLVLKNDSTHDTNEDVKVTATVDARNLSVAKAISVDAPKGVKCTVDANLIICNGGSLAAGASITIKVRVQGVKEGKLAEFDGQAQLLSNPSDRPGNSTASYFFDVVAPSKPRISFIPMNYGDDYQVAVTGEVTLDTGDTYYISLDDSDDGAESTSFEWEPITETLSITATSIKSVDLQISLTSSVSLTETNIVTDAAPMAYLGFNAVPASGIASIGSPSLTECGMSAYVTPPPVRSANVENAQSAQRLHFQGGADLELTCTDDGEVEWHNQPNVGFANIHATFEPQSFVQATACSDDQCTTTQTVQLTVTIEALPEVAAFLPLVY